MPRSLGSKNLSADTARAGRPGPESAIPLCPSPSPPVSRQLERTVTLARPPRSRPGSAPCGDVRLQSPTDVTLSLQHGQARRSRPASNPASVRVTP